MPAKERHVERPCKPSIYWSMRLLRHRYRGNLMGYPVRKTTTAGENMHSLSRQLWYPRYLVTFSTHETFKRGPYFTHDKQPHLILGRLGTSWNVLGFPCRCMFRITCNGNCGTSATRQRTLHPSSCRLIACTDRLSFERVFHPYVRDIEWK